MGRAGELDQKDCEKITVMNLSLRAARTSDSEVTLLNKSCDCTTQSAILFA
jgi:hypothetical protein